MKTRYTAVFEFDGDPPRVSKTDGWLGGQLVRIAFLDDLDRLDKVTVAANAMLDAVDDGSIDRMDKVWADLDNALRQGLQP